MTRAAAPQAQRFYPADIEPFAFEPLRSAFVIKPAGETKGEGLVALRDFAPGAVVFAFTGTLVTEITQYTLQLDANTHIHDPYVMGKVLHHCAPNCHVDMERRTFVAVRPIAAGDYVTMDYCQTEDVLFKAFRCNCGAPDCRGFIMGRAQTPQLVLEEFVLAAERRLANLVRSASRYETLVRIAAICQEFGNELSRLIYAASTRGESPQLACKSGCATCCHIPYTVPQVATTDFTMTVLDVITLVEHLHELKPDEGKRPFATASGILPVAPCPQLTQAGSCSIYDKRPVTCKIWFSANLDLCVSNSERGYKAGVNPLTDESDRLRLAFEEPFAQCVEALVPGLVFRGHDFMAVFQMTTVMGRKGLAQAFRTNIDAGLTLAAAFELACANEAAENPRKVLETAGNPG